MSTVHAHMHAAQHAICALQHSTLNAAGLQAELARFKDKDAMVSADGVE